MTSDEAMPSGCITGFQGKYTEVCEIKFIKDDQFSASCFQFALDTSESDLVIHQLTLSGSQLVNTSGSTVLTVTDKDTISGAVDLSFSELGYTAEFSAPDMVMSKIADPGSEIGCVTLTQGETTESVPLSHYIAWDMTVLLQDSTVVAPIYLYRAYTPETQAQFSFTMGGYWQQAVTESSSMTTVMRDSLTAETTKLMHTDSRLPEVFYPAENVPDFGYTDDTLSIDITDNTETSFAASFNGIDSDTLEAFSGSVTIDIDFDFSTPAP
ncbi:MAG: hypothetical protein HRU20_06045 [Pseudomonadales bacterium]|nr:hypothetical protein [Pseudomonadales bacterium]